MTREMFTGLSTEETASRLRSLFEDKYRKRPRLFRAPGRVNLIGEHTDYNQGWVMPAALNFSTWVAIAPRTDQLVRVSSLNFDQQLEFQLHDRSGRAGKWSDYVRGVVQLLGHGSARLVGADLLLWGDVPLGAGLSSSASLEVSVAAAMTAISAIEISKEDLARLCQRAENEFVGARCGIMDQFISVNGKAGNALMLDCRSLQYELVPLPRGVSLVLANTMVKHQLSGGEYNLRRSECEQGVRILQQWYPAIQSLRDLTVDQLQQHRSEIPEVIFRRCRHVVTENHRVLDFAQALRTEDLQGAGELMRSSHRSLRDDFEVSSPELNVMVDIAGRQVGLIGVRMTGGGFGGCTVNLVRDEAVATFRDDVESEYRRQTGIAPEIYVTCAADGASEISLSS